MTGVTAASADPADYVLTPLVVAGERELDMTFGSADGPGARTSAGSVALAYSPTGFWASEVYAHFARSPSAGTGFDGVEWENRFQLTEPGRYAVDWGWVASLEKPHLSGEGWYATVGPLLQGSVWQLLQWNFNPLLTRNWNAPAAGSTDLSYQLQLKYRYRPSFEFGLQGFGDLGPWYHWSSLDAQSHRMGPAVFGRWPLGGRQVLLYNAGWLLGLDPGAPHSTLRAQIEFEF